MTCQNCFIFKLANINWLFILNFLNWAVILNNYWTMWRMPRSAAWVSLFPSLPSWLILLYICNAKDLHQGKQIIIIIIIIITLFKTQWMYLSTVALLIEETTNQIDITTYQIKAIILVFGERGKPEYSGKNLSEQSREPTTSVPIWQRVRRSNPGHIGDRQVLTPLHQPCSPKKDSTLIAKDSTINWEEYAQIIETKLPSR